MSHPTGNDNEIMNTLELNRIALWKPKLCDELTIRASGAGRPYIENNTIKKTTAKTYRYAKNYKKKDTAYCLFVITYTDKANIVEAQLDKIAEKLKIKEIEEAVSKSTSSSFTYTKYFLEEK